MFTCYSLGQSPSIKLFMKICITNNCYPPNGFGGAERTVAVLAKGLLDFGHDVSVICIAQKMFGAHDNNGVKVYGLAK